jgi:hypothetical protein
LEESNQITELIEKHRLLYAQGPDEMFVKDRMEITICYTLKNGREVYRYYRTPNDGVLAQWFQQLFDADAP